MGGMKIDLETANLKQIAVNSVLQVRVFESSVRRERRFFMGRWQTVQGEHETFSLLPLVSGLQCFIPAQIYLSPDSLLTFVVVVRPVRPRLRHNFINLRQNEDRARGVQF